MTASTTGGSTGSGTSAGRDLAANRARGSRPQERLTTETKHAFKTTEFIAYVAVLLGILIAGLTIEDKGGNDFFDAQKVWLYATILTVGYMISRGLAKSGSRDPYWGGGTNERRDDDR